MGAKEEHWLPLAHSGKGFSEGRLEPAGPEPREEDGLLQGAGAAAGGRPRPGKRRKAVLGAYAAAALLLACLVGFQLGAGALAGKGGMTVNAVKVGRSSRASTSLTVHATLKAPVPSCLLVRSAALEYEGGMVSVAEQAMRLDVPEADRGSSVELPLNTTAVAYDAETGRSQPLERFVGAMARSDAVALTVRMRARPGVLLGGWCAAVPLPVTVSVETSFPGFGNISALARMEDMRLAGPQPGGECPAKPDAKQIVPVVANVSLSNPSTISARLPAMRATVTHDNAQAVAGTLAAADLLPGNSASLTLAGELAGPGAPAFAEQFLRGSGGRPVTMDVSLQPLAANASAMDWALAKAAALRLALPPQAPVSLREAPGGFLLNENATTADTLALSFPLVVSNPTMLHGQACTFALEVRAAGGGGPIIGRGILRSLPVPHAGSPPVTLHIPVDFERTDANKYELNDMFRNFMNGKGQDLHLTVAEPPALEGVVLPPLELAPLGASLMADAAFDVKAALASVQERHFFIWVDLVNAMRFTIKVGNLTANMYVPLSNPAPPPRPSLSLSL